MLRVMGLALLFVVGAATPAEADGIARVAEGGPVTAHSSAATPGARAVMRERRGRVQLTGALITTQAPLRGGSWGGLRRDVVNPTAGPTVLPAQRRSRTATIELPWVSRGSSGLALPVTERFFVGLGYRRVQGEDLWHEFAETGSVDYDSHYVLVRAHWRF